MRETIVGSLVDDDAAELTPNAMLVVDRVGDVKTLNTGASGLFPDLLAGAPIASSVAWLADAHRRCARDVSDAGHPDLRVATGLISGARYQAHPAALGHGDVAWSLVADAGPRTLEAEQALARERHRTAVLSEASSSMMATLNVERCRRVIVSLAARHLADAAIVVTRVGRGHRLHLVGSDPMSATRQYSVDVDPRTVPGLSEALDGLPLSAAQWVDPLQLPDWLVAPGLTGAAGAVVIATLPGAGQAVGALVLLRQSGAPPFDSEEERFAHVFASRAGAALTTARLYTEQAAVTRTLMHDLLPPQLHRLHGIEYAGGYRAAGDFEVVGGDFYDVHPGATPEDDTLVVLGDVCGKGLEAAVLSGKIRTTVQALRSLSGEHQSILTLLNDTLLSSEHTRFATMVVASVFHRGGSPRLRLSSAGHLPPLLIRSDGEVHPADTGGTVVGVLPHIKTKTVSTSLEPGEACVLYTDGVTEARGGLSGRELLGEQRLAASLRGCDGMPAEAIVERVMMLATDWAGSRARDDMAVVVISAPRRTHLSAVDGHTRGRYIA